MLLLELALIHSKDEITISTLVTALLIVHIPFLVFSLRGKEGRSVPFYSFLSAALLSITGFCLSSASLLEFCFNVSAFYFLARVAFPLFSLSQRLTILLLSLFITGFFTNSELIHKPLEILTSIALGELFFWISKLIFALKDPTSLKRVVLREAGNLGALIISNEKSFWDKSYSSLQWEFLRNKNQNARHYAIAGMISNRFSNENLSVLDIGCGFAQVRNALRRNVGLYHGIDLSRHAIEFCRKDFADKNSKFWEVHFQDFSPHQSYDAIIMNEVLYYSSIQEAPTIIEKTKSLLKADGILIVSMNKNPKAAFMWKILNKMMLLEEELAVLNLHGSKWTIRAYKKKK